MAKKLTAARAAKIRLGVRLALSNGYPLGSDSRLTWLAYCEWWERRERRQRAGQW